MLTIKAMAGGETYAANHLSNNDYYSVGETVTGQWIGRGAERLGLSGVVTMEQFEAIRLGNHPETGEFLRQRQSADRLGVDGEKIATARNLYDFTISAPKDVSIQALEDPRLVDAHKIAVDEALGEMERIAGTRVRRFGANENRETGNLVIARYEHDTSRELDPQLHTHLVAGNLTWDTPEERWKALQASGIYAEREYLTEVYRNALAREVTTRGYSVEDRFKHGKDHGFGIVGIEEATREKYSRRSAQRDASIRDFLQSNGRLPSDNEVARLVRDSRPEKLAEISTAEVKAAQRQRLDPVEAATLKGLKVTAMERGSVRESAPAAPSVQHSSDHIFERVSVAKDYELKTEALRHGRGRVELSEIMTELQAGITRGNMLSAGKEIATQQSLDRERLMVKTINEGVAAFEPLGRGQRFEPSARLRPEQKTAILAALASRDLAFNLRGAAGTGKTSALQDLQRGLTEARRGTVPVAPTATAVEELRKAGLTHATTVARLLSDPGQQQQLAGQVLIVDEAGMLSSKDMADVLKLARNQKARIVFSGDTAQIKSVLEGDALRVLEHESNLKTVSLLQVQRQTNLEYKAAVEALRTRPTEGFSKLEQMGAIQEVDWRLRSHHVSQAYREASLVPSAKGQPRSVLVVAASHDELSSTTYVIREDRKRAGEIADGKTFSHHSPLYWTDAQKRQTKNYRPGQVLEFHEAIKGVKKNEALEVVSGDRHRVVARTSAGKNITIAGPQTKSFEVFEKRDIEVSAGDKLLLKSNRRGRSFRSTNGELVTVQSVDSGAIELQDGRTIPAEYRQFSHGYAVTAHISQGKTVDFQVISAERMAHDLFYVSVSRGREGVAVITSDRLTLQESISVSGDRQSAIELARRAGTRRTELDDFQFYYSQHPTPAIPQEIHHGSTQPSISIGF